MHVYGITNFHVAKLASTFLSSNSLSSLEAAVTHELV